MKQPRTSDFDPSAIANSANSAKERELRSPLNDFPAIERPEQVDPAGDPQQAVLPVPPVRGVREVRASSLTPVGGRRKIKSRHPFDIYEDQLEELKKLSLEDRMRGGPGSMSAMVREAIDDYIAKVRV